jgi:hypothetical protein
LGNGLLKRGHTSNAISSSNFDTGPHHPFANGNVPDLNPYNEYTVEEEAAPNRAVVETSQITSDVDGNSYVEMVIDLYRQESGFGFRIVGVLIYVLGDEDVIFL